MWVQPCLNRLPWLSEKFYQQDKVSLLSLLRPVFQFTAIFNYFTGYLGNICDESCPAVILFLNCTLFTDILNFFTGCLGNICDEPCPAGTWGRSLSLVFLITDVFNFFTGYLGDNCDEPCPTGTWGLNCTQSCACLNGARCHHNTGFCNCTVGYHGNINISAVTCDHRFR